MPGQRGNRVMRSECLGLGWPGIASLSKPCLNTDGHIVDPGEPCSGPRAQQGQVQEVEGRRLQAMVAVDGEK